MPQNFIDLNCDLGEGAGNDACIIPFISSANIACGYHAGDIETMDETIRLCLKHNVKIGAHPSYNDRENFGRKPVDIQDDQLIEQVIMQVKLLQQRCVIHGAQLNHIKPHGALYNRLAADEKLTKKLCNALIISCGKTYYTALAASIGAIMAEDSGLPVIHEFFADRTYMPDATLTPRTHENALITNDRDAIDQALSIAGFNAVQTFDGHEMVVAINTNAVRSICLHGDGLHAVEFAKAINHHLHLNGYQIEAPIPL